MARLTDVISEFIKALLDESEGELELQRNEMAEYFDCAPSQINYVLATRFSINQGYYIESRKGGGGYIRITQLDVDKDDYMLYLVTEGIGERLSQEKALQYIERMVNEDFIDRRDGYIMKGAILDKAIGLPSPLKEITRASIMKSMITEIMALGEKEN